MEAAEETIEEGFQRTTKQQLLDKKARRKSAQRDAPRLRMKRSTGTRRIKRMGPPAIKKTELRNAEGHSIGTPLSFRAEKRPPALPITEPATFTPHEEPTYDVFIDK
jgi:hypothetical protein